MNMPKILTNTQIKYLAAFFMLLDHLALILIPGGSTAYLVLRSIGRLSAPLFFWAIAEGAFYTKNIWKYLSIILGFGILYHLVYFFYLEDTYTLFTFLSSYKNIFITLALGLGGIISIKNRMDNKVLVVLMVLLFGALGLLLNVDYSWYGVIMIMLFFIFRNKFIPLTISIIILNILFLLTGSGSMWSYIQLISIFSLIFVYMYNGKRGSGHKYFFYIFYPLHLVILYLISYFL